MNSEAQTTRPPPAVHRGRLAAAQQHCGSDTVITAAQLVLLVTAAYTKLCGQKQGAALLSGGPVYSGELALCAGRCITSPRRSVIKNI